MGWSVVAAVVMLALAAAPADAQTGDASTQAPSKKWQLETFGGLSIFNLPSGGTSQLPPPGAPLLTSGPINQSRRVSTWFLGDGASLLNGVNAEFGVAARITTLDSALTTLGLTGANAPAFGFRLRRLLSDRLAVEANIDILPGSRELTPELIAAAEAARSSFVSAFTGLLATGPFTAPAVTATTAVSNSSSRDLTTTVAAQWMFGSQSLSPYVTLGAGLVHKIGDLPAITLTGNYRFTLLGTVPINETDTLHLRHDQGTALVAVAGAGLRRTLNERFGFSIDGRLLLGKQTLTLQLDSEPVVTTGTPADFIESFTTPAIQFSNNRTTGRESTLSGAPLDGFKAVSTNGFQTRFIFTAGVFLRF